MCTVPYAGTHERSLAEEPDDGEGGGMWKKAQEYRAHNVWKVLSGHRNGVVSMPCTVGELTLFAESASSGDVALCTRAYYVHCVWG